MDLNLIYREVLVSSVDTEDWTDVEINTGTQHTLQDIKTSENSGGYCFKSLKNAHSRNRFIYWRAYQDVLELVEISLDLNLTKNKVRMRFTDTTVLAVSITEHEHHISLLVATVSSLHQISFPYNVDSKSNNINGINIEESINNQRSSTTTSSRSSSTTDTNAYLTGSHSYSIFRNVNSSASLNDPSTYHTIDGNNILQHQLPHAATCYMERNSSESYFALAYQAKLMVYVMNKSNAKTDSNVVTHELKKGQSMPEFLTTLKGALSGKADGVNSAISLSFSHICGHTYLLALYCSDELRLWSMESLQPICELNCLGIKIEPSKRPRNCALRKINDVSYCIYLVYKSAAEFVCIDIVSCADESNANNLSLELGHSIPAPQTELVDFGASEERIWALWNNGISSFAVKDPMGMYWISAAQDPLPDRYILAIEQGVDPKETYCSYIFQPGKFEPSVISKALYMFRRVNMLFDVKQLTTSMLKEQVCQAVEDEIQNEMKEFVVSDEEYLEVATRMWERFYSCCEQYSLKYREPTGLVVLDTMDAVCIVRKQTFSLLRPCDMLENLMLLGDYVDKGIVNRYFRDNPTSGTAFISLVMLLAKIDQWIPEKLKLDLEKKMYQLEKPAMLISNLVNDILCGTSDSEVLSLQAHAELRQRLHDIKDICGAIDILHDMLSMEEPDETMEHQTYSELAQSSKLLMAYGSLCGSDYGISILADTVKQATMIRYALSRNLLILEKIAIDTHAVSADQKHALDTKYMPDSIVYFQAYSVMVWIAETSVNLSTAANLESSLQRLYRAQLLHEANHYYVGYGKRRGNATLLQLFLQSKGLYAAMAMLVSDGNVLEKNNLQHTLLPLAFFVKKLVWVCGFNFTFGEWLFGTCQHVIIQDYVRMLSTWCEWNINSRQFMLAVSLLDCGETQKAYSCFVRSSEGVLKEKFLFEHILRGTEFYNNLHNVTARQINIISRSREVTIQATGLCFLKIIQLFEQYQDKNFIIALAQVAMGQLNTESQHMAMFQTILFNNHLQLEHYEEAYQSLINNSDASRRKDCLRQLVITLFERKRLDILRDFPYTGVFEDFENIVETRARSLTMAQNRAYAFLYAYHVNKGNMRKASAIMYEQSMRYKIETDLPEALSKRCTSLLICINAMELLDERYRWLVKPIINNETIVSAPSSDLINDHSKQVIVLNIRDVRRELLHAEALLELSLHRSEVHAYMNASAQELSYLLASCGLFSSALKLAKNFDVSPIPIFDSLTVACVRATDEKSKETRSWLQNNDLKDLPYRSKATDTAWDLLQKLVAEHELPQSTQLQKTIVNKLLLLNEFVPQWLYCRYKASDCIELLRLFVQHNRLMDASELALEIIEGMLGAGSEYFSFKRPIAAHNPPLALPVNTMDVLLYGLNLNGTEHLEYKLAHMRVEEALKKYVETVLRVTEDEIRTAKK